LDYSPFFSTCPVFLVKSSAAHLGVKNKALLTAKKSNHLSSQWVVNLSLGCSLASMLMAADGSGWWLLKVGVAAAIS